MTEAQWTLFGAVATTLSTFAITEFRASRTRRWANEDRDRNAKEAIAARDASTAEIISKAAAEAEATRIKTESIAATLQRHTELTAAQLREEARIGAENLVTQAAQIAAELKKETAKTGAELTLKIEEATGTAKAAYTEANHVNNKIEDLNQRIMQVAKIPASANKKIEKIDETTTRIEAKVDADSKTEPS